MRTPFAHVAVVGALALMLAPGCSSMMKRWDNITGKSDRAERKQGTVELNSATRKRLSALPGLTDDDADRIIANRPYAKPRELVSKGVLTQSKLDKIREDVYVDHAKN